MKRLVCLHGFTGAPASFDALREGLRDDFEITAPALSGHAGAGFDGVESFDDEVSRLLDRCGRGPVTLVGYSLGARLGLGMLRSAPEKFSAALLLGGHPGLTDDSERATRIRSDARWAALLRERGLDAFLAEWESQPLFASQKALGAASLAAQHAIRHAHDASGLARSLELFGLGQMPEHWSALPGLEVPIILGAGELDSKFAELAARAARALPRGSVSIAPGAGHNLLLERPDWVVRAIFSVCSQT